MQQPGMDPFGTNRLMNDGGLAAVFSGHPLHYDPHMPQNYSHMHVDGVAAMGHHMQQYPTSLDMYSGHGMLSEQLDAEDNLPVPPAPQGSLMGSPLSPRLAQKRPYGDLEGIPYKKSAVAPRASSFALPNGPPPKKKAEPKPKCQVENCRRKPVYGLPGGEATHCALHKSLDQADMVGKHCGVAGCQDVPSYGPATRGGAAKPKYCARHRDAEPGLVSLRGRKYCQSEACLKLALCNYPSLPNVAFCAEHAAPGMEYKHKRRKCGVDGCEKNPSFNFPGLVALRCSLHKEPGMLDRKCRNCEVEGCSKQANWTWGPPPGTDVNDPGYQAAPPVRCHTHREKGMMDNRHRKCEHEDCNRRPFFCEPDGLKARFCSKHKTPDMMNPQIPRCEAGCGKYAIYGLKGQDRRPRLCTEHKTEIMVAIKSRICLYDGCTGTARYGEEGGKPQYCTKHKQQGMLDVLMQRCRYPGCKVSPTFGYDDRKTVYCFNHKKEGMFNVRNKRCEREGCKVFPTYSFAGDRPRFCAAHRMEGMADVSKRKCERPECRDTPSFAFAPGVPRFCMAHFADGVIDVVTRKCDWEGCTKYAYFGDPYTSGQATRCPQHRRMGSVDVRSHQCEYQAGLPNSLCKRTPYFGAEGEHARFCTVHRAPHMVDLKSRTTFVAQQVTLSSPIDRDSNSPTGMRQQLHSPTSPQPMQLQPQTGLQMPRHRKPTHYNSLKGLPF